jgi:tRNA pseudouridine13 synthase
MGEIKSPDLESLVGMDVYLSKTAGIGGMIKKLPQDFIVEEILEDMTVLEAEKDLGLVLGEKKEYLHFTLDKYNWDTMRAIKVLSNKLHVGKKRFGFAGTKDKRALTTQRVSVWNTDAEKLKNIYVKDIILRDPVYSAERINLGMLWGNRFTMTIRDLDLPADALKDRIDAIIAELGGKVPNFFGLQRFGTVRPTTHLVGKAILERKFEDAVMIYLAAVYPGEEEASMEARKFLAESRDFKEAMKRFPKHLGYEIAMLNHLSVTPTDFVGALRELPKKLRWMFVHAYQAYLFNLALSEYLRNGIRIENLPLVGYSITLDDVTERLFAETGLTQEAFRVNEMPELSSEGLMRECFVEIVEPKVVKVEEDDLHPGKSKAVVSFSLSKGSYATAVLRELMKNEYWETSRPESI